MIAVLDVWDFVLGTTASESRPWATLNVNGARVDIPTQRLVIRSGFGTANNDGDTYRMVANNAPGRRPYLNGYRIQFDLMPLARGSIRYRDIVTGSSLAQLQVDGGPLVTNVNIRAVGSIPGFVTVTIPAPAVPLKFEVFWKNTAKQIAFRVQHPGGTVDTGFFLHASVGSTFGLPQFDWTADNSTVQDCFSMGNIEGFQDLTDEEVDNLYRADYLTAATLLPAATAKLSHARILRGERVLQGAQQFHDAMKVAT